MSTDPTKKKDDHVSTSKALDDEQRVKVLSPGMLVAKRFFRNKLAVAGLVILVAMFLFSFIGGMVSPYNESQVFRKMELKKEMFWPRGQFLKMILSLGMASCINQIAMAVVQITMNNTLRHYGAASVYGTDIPLACVGVISKVNMVFMAIAIGISQGCQPIWGYNYGAGSYDRVKRTYWKAFRIAMTVGIVFFLCFQFFPTQLVSIFGTGSKEYYEFAARYFRIFMFMTFVNGIQPMSSGFFTSIGKAKLGIVVSLTRQVIFLLPLILIFPLFMGIDGVMYAGPIADAAAGIVAIGFAVKELRAMDKIA